MKVEMVAYNEILIQRAERGARRFEYMPTDLVQVKLSRKQIAFKLVTKRLRLIQYKPRRHRRTEMRQRWHELGACPFVFIDHFVVLAVDASINRVNHGVALSTPGVLEERAIED